MGVIKFFSSSSFDYRRSDYQQSIDRPVRGNPDPKNYKIIKTEAIGNHLIMWINYPECENYEGNKILLFKNTILTDLTIQKEIDPHFSNNKSMKSPFARFEPTEEGWRIGIETAKILV